MATLTKFVSRRSCPVSAHLKLVTALMNADPRVMSLHPLGDET